MTRRSTLLLTAIATVAFAAPAFGQTYTRDHRVKPAPVQTKGPRQPEPVPSRRGQRVAPPTIASYAPHAGIAGTAVTIQGRGFEAGSVVLYNGVRVAPISVTNRSVTFAIPATAIDAQISVLGPSARTATAVGAFDVTPPPRVRRPAAPANNARSQSRRGRRNQTAQRYQSRWQRAFLADAKTKAELTLHAERIAKLERMKRLAANLNDAALNRRIALALTRENTRHEQSMLQLERAFFA